MEKIMVDNPDSYLQIVADGRKYKTTLTKKFLNRKPWKAPDPGQVRSFIPGEVFQLLVKSGDKVRKGDKMMIYEAMKMKNIITAPFDARIEEVFVEEGDKLPKGALLVKLVPIN